MSLKFVPRGPINNIPALVQCLDGAKPLSEPMLDSLPTHICVIRPQWVNAGLEMIILLNQFLCLKFRGFLWIMIEDMQSQALIGFSFIHYSDVIIHTMAFQITCVSIICSTVYLGADQRKYKNSVSQAFVRGIHRSPMDSTHEGLTTRKMFPFDDIIMECIIVNTEQDNIIITIANSNQQQCPCTYVQDQSALHKTNIISICEC